MIYRALSVVIALSLISVSIVSAEGEKGTLTIEESGAATIKIVNVSKEGAYTSCKNHANIHPNLSISCKWNDLSLGSYTNVAKNPDDSIQKKIASEESSTKMRKEYYEKYKAKGYDVSLLTPEILDGKKTNESKFWEVLQQVQNKKEIPERREYVKKLSSQGADTTAFTEVVIEDSGKFWDTYKKAEASLKTDGVKNPVTPPKKKEQGEDYPSESMNKTQVKAPQKKSPEDRYIQLFIARLDRVPDEKLARTAEILERNIKNQLDQARSRGTKVGNQRFERMLEIVRETRESRGILYRKSLSRIRLIKSLFVVIFSFFVTIFLYTRLHMMQSEKFSDILQKAKKGDQKGFSSLYDLSYDRIYTFIFYRVLDNLKTEDIISDVFYKILKSLSGFRGDTQEEYFAWIYRICYTTIIDHSRSKIDIESLDELLWEPSHTPRDTIDAHSKIVEITQYLKTLSHKEQMIVTLRLWDDLSYEEIASTTGESQTNIRKIYSGTLEKITANVATLSLIIIFISYVFKVT